ncbi:DUF11 domain-containing protein [Maribacter sp. PR1]|uniref:DUF11 domain-containing protein n=1 Tax=Maribacter cobaltidurans TaxID=1178778 RepID=A0ABU7IXH1_9FLAO|nr:MULTISPECIES: DUF11 domain-containing protein [Maribacter]MDC6390307.1 DUF11 domain-containing protein [Maribacter sp. PR1]MEE1977697.1 DUF11 domain-containing protein [Maribacter cobaltidurans]
MLKLKIFNFLVVVFITAFSYGQLSNLHYLPPLKQGQNNQAIQQQAVHLSTPVTSSFMVNVYRGTSITPITSFTISKTSPAVYDPGNGDNNITLVSNSNTGVILSNSGLRFEAPSGEKFYVNYRGRSGSQAASLTSKGRSALGTRFKWGGVPNLGSHPSKSNTLGIMATEDNTTVTISGYDPNCEFRLGNNVAGITANSYSITLDANESFVFENYVGNSPTTANSQGWIGASVLADKDIVISNGSLNYGRQVGNSNRDAGIDQPVPEDKLGKEYVFVRGNGNSNGWTEFPIIIGVANNTQIFVNGSTTPIATINNGEYFEIPSSNYSSNSVGANMFVETSKDVYAYQCLGGSTAAYTQGLNFVAPVNCLLPDVMDNIPDITDVAGTTISGGVTIIASTATPDANITVMDGGGTVSLPASNAVAGSTDWKTFYIPNLTDDVSVQSTGPVAVGFFGFNGARGVAGYFSGFDTTPNVDLQITGAGCLPGAALEIAGSETFDAYQWYSDGTIIPGATGSSYAANTAGDYYVRVTRGSCTYDSNALSVYYCNPDIQLIKNTDTESLNEGDIVNFTISVQNFGVNPATNTVVTDVLPSGISLISATPTTGSWSYPNWNVGTLVSGQLETITITATANFNTSPNQIAHLANVATNSQDQVDNNFSLDKPTVAFILNNDFDADGVVDVLDLDDDNDGILDCTESEDTLTNGQFGWYLNSPSGTRAMDGIYDPAISSWFLASSTNIAFSGITATTPTSAVQINNMPSNTLEEALYNNDYIEVSFTTANNLSNPVLNSINWGWYQPSGGDSYTMSAYLSADGFVSSIQTVEGLFITNDATTYQVFDLMNQTTIPLLANTTYTLRVYVYGQIDDDGTNFSTFDDINFTVSSCRGVDSDSDNIMDSYELDADNDTCSDANEAYADYDADGGDDGVYGNGLPAVNLNGTVVAATYPTPADGDSNGNYDFQETGSAPNITVQPMDTTTFVNTDSNIESMDDGDNYQWQLSTDGGTTFNDISDGSEYSGTTTNTLIVITPEIDKNGYLYRVIITDDSYVCGSTTSNSALLTVGIRTVISNRRITYRVNKN